MAIDRSDGVGVMFIGAAGAVASTIAAGVTPLVAVWSSPLEW